MDLAINDMIDSTYVNEIKDETYTQMHKEIIKFDKENSIMQIAIIDSDLYIFKISNKEFKLTENMKNEFKEYIHKKYPFLSEVGDIQ